VQVSLEGDGPLYQRLYRALRRAILDGRLPAGARLPSTRGLAVDLGLSRNAVLMAFDQLLAEGYVDGRVGSGTFVSSTLPDSDLMPWSAAAAAPPAAGPPRLSAVARRVLSLAPLPPAGATVRSVRYDFRYGLPAFEDFPHETWRRIVTRRARAASLRTLGYGRAAGFPPLREAIAAYLRKARGVVATADQVVIVNGSQQALSLAAHLLLDHEDRVVVEEPSYQAARQIFLASGARLLARPVDEAGLDVTRLPTSGKVRLAYVTPSHQFPSGAVLSLSRRLDLLRWAERTGAYILEDDYDAEFRYEGRPVAAVQGLDRAGRVLYVGTFSKVLFPSLRVGYLVVPPLLVPGLVGLKWLTDCHTPTFEQEVLTDFIEGGHFERHLRRSRARNAARRAAVLEAFARTFGSEVTLTGANAGIHVVAWLHGVEATGLPDLIDRAGKRGVGLYPVTPYYVRPPREAGLLVGYASLSEEEIEKGVGILAEVLSDRGAHDYHPAPAVRQQ
jgi:GntR family transcriptional regulator / MocR family aminotransferase